MIHALIHTPASDTTYPMAPALTQPWAELLLTWWWFGPPFESIKKPNPEVLWKEPLWSDADYDTSKLGARSMMHIAGSRLAQSGEGFDDTDFAREGLPDETGTPGDREWGL